MNPSIAARSLLVRGFGRRRVARAIRRTARFRRSFHRGNPLPALVGSVLPSIPGLKNLFKKRSHLIAAELAPAIVAAANSGNLTAARGLMERAVWPMNPQEHTVWAAAEKQLAPKIRAAVKRYADRIPQASQRNPKEFVGSLTPGIDLNEIEADAAAEASLSKAERAEAAREARVARTQLLGTVADVGVAGLQAFAGRGRRPATRRRRRRAPSRAFSF